MTGEGEVRVVIASVVLPGNNVLNVKRDSVVTLMNAAIFATVSRSIAHT
jgi:hypothetical protein